METLPPLPIEGTFLMKFLLWKTNKKSPTNLYKSLFSAAIKNVQVRTVCRRVDRHTQALPCPTPAVAVTTSAAGTLANRLPQKQKSRPAKEKKENKFAE